MITSLRHGLSDLALSGLPIALNDVMEMSIELEATDLLSLRGCPR